MENKEIPTLEQKQAFWAEQLPNFEDKYWMPSHFEFLVFDMEQGNYVIKDDLDPSFEDDATEIWHRVNTGWAMWKKAIKFTEQKATPEGFVLVSKEVKWIDINKLTPEYDQLVLVASGDDVFCAYWRHAKNFGGYFESNLNITQWMPLPEPPDEEKEQSHD